MVAPADSSWESDLVAALGDLLEHDVRTAADPGDVRDVDGVALCGDQAWCEALVSQAKAAQTLGRAVLEHAEAGGLLLAIGAGFAAACSLGLLPGHLEGNEPAGFLSRMVALRVEGVANPWAERAMVGDIWRMPVRTAFGRYTADEADLDHLERDGLILLRYLDNPNQSERNIAAIMSARRNVLGIVPHPENVVDASLLAAQWPGLESGRVLFDSVEDWIDQGGLRGPIESQR